MQRLSHMHRVTNPCSEQVEEPWFVPKAVWHQSHSRPHPGGLPVPLALSASISCILLAHRRLHFICRICTAFPLKRLYLVRSTNRDRKRCSTLLIIRVLQIKTTTRYRLTPVRMTIIKKSRNNKCWEFPGGLVVRIQHFAILARGSVPGQGTEILQPVPHGQNKSK